MKTKMNPPVGRRLEAGGALFMVMIFGTLTAILCAGVLSWSMTNTRMVARVNERARVQAAAEAAVEKVVAHIGNDYQNSDLSMVYANLNNYRTMTPDLSESYWWGDYTFVDSQGEEGRVAVDFLPLSTNTLLSSKYPGFRGTAVDVRVGAGVISDRAGTPVVGRCIQDLQLSLVSVFQYAIFYNLDLEINPGPEMIINGPVHCNRDMYLQPGTSLLFKDLVTAAGSITQDKKAGDQNNRSPGPLTFEEGQFEDAFTMNLPLGSFNTTESARSIVEVPAIGEHPASLAGRERYYNKSDMIVSVDRVQTGTKNGKPVYKDVVTARSGSFNGFSTVIPDSQVATFVSTSSSFTDQREGKTVNVVDIDVAKLGTWSKNNTSLRSVLPHKDVRSVYVVDNRPKSSSEMPGVRLLNGQTLPPKGLTVATPAPLYIKGNYNVTSSGLGTHNTSASLPASVVADAVTVLSGNWVDANSTKELSSRVAADTTVNAAFLAGIVETDSAFGGYSGGVENFPRFLEKWEGKQLTYTGSMVVLFPSAIAKAKWKYGGLIYTAPKRDWAFDTSFSDPTKLPPGSPMVRLMIRGTWSD